MAPHFTRLLILLKQFHLRTLAGANNPTKLAISCLCVASFSKIDMLRFGNIQIK